MKLQTVKAWVLYGIRLAWYYIRTAASILYGAYQLAPRRAAHANDPIPWEEDPITEDNTEMLLLKQRETLFRLLDSIETQLEETTDPKQTMQLLTRQASTQNKLILLERRLQREEEGEG